MSSLIDFALNEEYTRLEFSGGKLTEIGYRIDWKSFSSMIGSISDNEIDSGDMPEADSIAMITWKMKYGTNCRSSLMLLD